MTLRYLLDTNVLSEAAKPVPNASVVNRIRVHHDEVATSAQVWDELLYGCYRLPESARRRRLEYYIRETLGPWIPILEFDETAAEWHAAERARLSLMGLTPPIMDGQTAAVAFTNGLILVTANVSDFANFQGLQVEDWSV